MSYKVIACLGDSIANGYWDERGPGWFGRLAEKIAGNFPGQYAFNNLAMSGDRVVDTWHRLCSEVISRGSDILIISTGVNDTARLDTPEAPMDISHGCRREMWANILEAAKNNLETVIVCGMTPVLENRLPQEGAYNMPLFHMNSDIAEYNKLLAGWCGEYGIPFLPLERAWSGQNTEHLMSDATHPNGKGHELIAAFVYDELVSLGILG
jgi:lysophospholipase L1-like esterase